MFELFKIINEYYQKKKLKKLLKRRLVRMSNKVEIHDGQYFVNGRVLNDTDIVREMTKWGSENFIFKNQDVYLPAIPEPLFGSAVVGKHDDVFDLNKFKAKFGDISLSFMLYNAFLLGYESGIQRAENDSLERINKVIEESVDDSKELDFVQPKRKEEVKLNITKIENYQSDLTEEDKNVLDYILESNSTVEEVKECIKNDDFSKFMNPPEEPSEIIEEDKKEFVKPEMKEITEEDYNITLKEGDDLDKSKPCYETEGNLIVDSNFYKEKTYPKFISMIIEEKLSRYGMMVEDIYSKNFPSYIIGELLLEIQSQDAINSEQVAVRDLFYNYFKTIQEDVTKINTTT